MQGFSPNEQVCDHFGSNPQFARVLREAVPKFDIAAWGELTLYAALGMLSEGARERAEEALNGWNVAPKPITDRQAQFGAAHSGVQREPVMRDVLAKAGPLAMKRMAAGDITGARRALQELGLSRASIAVLLTGWQHDLMEHELDDKAPVCCVVNAVTARATYVGRVVRMDEQVLWQEIEPGQVVEHVKANLPELPAPMADPFYRQRAEGPDALHNAWMNSWCIAYDGRGKATIRAAALMLLNQQSVKPNPFTGPVIAETGRRFVQAIDEGAYAGHLKSLTGRLEIGRHYEISYHGALGQQVAEVKYLAPPAQALAPAAPEVAMPEVVVPQPAATLTPFAEAPAPAVPASVKLAYCTLRDWTEPRVDKAIVAIATAIWQKHQVVVVAGEIVDCLHGRRGNASYSGRILDVDHEHGLVVQSVGRRNGTVHRLADFAAAPQIDMDLDIKYRAGCLAVIKGNGQVRDVAR